MHTLCWYSPCLPARAFPVPTAKSLAWQCHNSVPTYRQVHWLAKETLLHVLGSTSHREQLSGAFAVVAAHIIHTHACTVIA